MAVVVYGDNPSLGYINNLLQPGMTVNVAPAETATPGEPVVADIIIVEPDFLMETSLVAACFARPDNHPLAFTVRRMQPRALSQAILLGNFAGIALDDIISTSPDCYDVAQSLRHAFRAYALQFCACPDFDARKFVADARQQAENLLQLPAFSHLITEPSFVCPALGLMGRVDLMAEDFSLLVEQKSGRNYRIERQAAVGGRDDHYIQLLLYYGILRYNFGLPYTHADIRLLYSKYPPRQGMFRVGFSMVRFAEAIRMRNTLVAWEYHIARQGFDTVLPTLAAADHDLQYLIPCPNDATRKRGDKVATIEQSYLSRMMTFVYREQLCAKAVAADLWKLQANEKHLAGTLLSGLTLVSRQPSSSTEQHCLLTFQLPSLSAREAGEGCDGGQEISIFRPGDSVYLYAYQGGNPDITAAILYKGTLVSIGHEQIVVATMGKPPFTSGDEIAIEPAPADTTINSHIRALRQFITGPAVLRQLLLGQRMPRANHAVTLSRRYHPDYDEVVLRACQAQDYFLLIGPPGTGKTTMAMRFLVEELLHSSSPSERENPSGRDGQSPSLLLTAYTNRAVDEICAMLDAASLPYLRLGSMSSSLEALLDRSPRLSNLKRHISEVPVIVATTSWLQSQPAVLSLKRFSAVIADEASQLTEPAVVGLLSQVNAPFILIGDHKQLPAVVIQPEAESSVSEPELRAIGVGDCRESLFQRLLRWEHINHRTAFVGILHRQGRMHPDIAHFPGSMFYADEQLLSAGLPHQQATTLGYSLSPADALDRLLQSRRVLFIPASHESSGEPASTASSHPLGKQDKPEGLKQEAAPSEARIVALLLHRLHRFLGSRFNAETVGVIVPYRCQIAAIRNALRHLPPCPPVTIDTVERYQGSQRDVIIYSFTATHPDQLDFLTSGSYSDGNHLIDRRLNVVMTRARKQLLLTGYVPLLSQNPIYRELISRYGVEMELDG